MTSTSVSTAEAFLKHCCCSATGREGKMWTGGQKLSNHKLPLQKETSAPTSPTPLWLTHYRMPAQKHTDTHRHTHTHTNNLTVVIPEWSEVIVITHSENRDVGRTQTVCVALCLSSLQVEEHPGCGVDSDVRHHCEGIPAQATQDNTWLQSSRPSPPPCWSPHCC